MKLIPVVFALTLIIASANCEEPQKEPEWSQARAQEIARKLDVAKKLPVPLPKRTHYDYDPRLRKLYLDAYTESYHMVLAGVYYGIFSRGKERAYLDGWQDGGEQASKDHPEKADEVFRFRMARPGKAK